MDPLTYQIKCPERLPLRYLILALGVGLLSACCDPPVDSFCAVAKPVYLSKEDVLTRDTLREIVTGNETWATLCKK